MAIKRQLLIDAVQELWIGYDTATGDIVILSGDTVIGRFDSSGAQTIPDALTVTGEIVGSAGLEVATGLVVGFDGNVTADAIKVGDGTFQLQYNSGSNPALQFDSTDRIDYVRASSRFDFVIAANSEMSLRTTGLSIANGLYVGDETGTPTDNDVRCEGALHAGSATSGYQTDKVSLTATEIKALAASPKTLVAAPGATEWVEFVSAQLVLNAGSEALTESADNLEIKYTDDTGASASETIETTGFIDQTADQQMPVAKAASATATMASLLNAPLVLDNTGDGEFGGNASDDATLDVYITYIVHTTA